MVIVLVIVALCMLVVGGALLTQATWGVGIIGGACLIAIIARLRQADDQHNERQRLQVEQMTMLKGLADRAGQGPTVRN